MKFTGLRDDITCVVFGRTTSMAHSDLPLIINQERPLQGKIEIIWHFIKGAMLRQSSSFCLILPITRPQSLWNLK